MEKFLDFLASNYIYFLIAAGVLFFALIGFIVDLKKKNKNEVDSGEVAPEVPMEAQSNPIPIDVQPVAPVEEAVPMTETFNPAPPVAEPKVEVMDFNQPIQMPVNPVPEEPKAEIEELK